MKILPNGIAVLEGDTHISKWVEESGRLDHDQSMLPRLLPYIKPGDWVIDGGAFIGDHTIAYLNAVGPGGVVMAFEPNKHAFQCLIHNCPKALSFSFALNDEEGGWIPLVESSNAGASFLYSGKLALKTKQYANSLALDTLNLPRLDFLKLDLEGMEMKAIKGATWQITKHKPVICLEMNQEAMQRQETSFTEITCYLENRGYVATKVYESDTWDGPQFDVLYVPKEKL